MSWGYPFLDLSIIAIEPPPKTNSHGSRVWKNMGHTCSGFNSKMFWMHNTTLQTSKMQRDDWNSTAIHIYFLKTMTCKNTIPTPVGRTATKSEFRIFVYCVVVSSLAMTWRLVPKWVWHPQQFFVVSVVEGNRKVIWKGWKGHSVFNLEISQS